MYKCRPNVIKSKIRHEKDLTLSESQADQKDQGQEIDGPPHV